MSQTRVAIANLGCKANHYDGTYLAALLKSRQFQLVDFRETADIYIINSCTVTDRADMDSRNLVRRAHRRNPEAVKVVTGCYAQTRPEEVARLEGVNLILGNDKKASLLDYLERARREREKLHIEVDDIFRQKELETFGMSSHTQNTRAYVKIQDGCNQFCSFCIIPFARGRNRSVSISRVLEELRDLKERGFQEAVLTGIHIGTYGQDLNPQKNLLDLLEAIEETKPIHRVRVSSIDPEEVSDRMIELFSASEVICPHLHLPLQSGDDALLKMMRRRYSRKDFWSLVEKVVQKIPRVCIGTDVIVGFPYEDETRFKNTYEVLEKAPVHYFHVFPFSPKRNTRAAQMMGQVLHRTKKERAASLRDLSQEKSAEYRRRFLGAEVEVLLERRNDPCQNETCLPPDEEWSGFSENYLPVLVQTRKGAGGRILRCRLDKQLGGKLAGKNYQG